MPWLEYPKKDVLICDKLGGVDKKRYNSKISEWGNLIRVIRIIRKADGHSVNWNILVALEKKSNEIPWVVTSETGIVQTIEAVGSFWLYGVVGIIFGEANKPSIGYDC